MIHMVPHERAPQWVYDVFKLINEKPESYGLDM